MTSTPQVLFKDRRFTVTTADIKTPSLYYPIGDTVGRVRKDIQFAALGLCALLGSALALYWDLCFIHEKAAIGAVILLAVIIAASLSVCRSTRAASPAACLSPVAAPSESCLKPSPWPVRKALPQAVTAKTKTRVKTRASDY